MEQLTIRDIAGIAGGVVKLGDLPPLGGELEPVGRIVVDSRDVQHGDLFWAMPGGAVYAEDAFARGALGVVTTGRHVEPWAGKFSILVDDTKWSLWQLAAAMRRSFQGEVIAVAGDDRASTRMLVDQALALVLPGAAPPASSRGNGQAVAASLTMTAMHEDDGFCTLEVNGGSGPQLRSTVHMSQPGIVVLTSYCAEAIETLLCQKPSLVIAAGDNLQLRRALDRRAAADGVQVVYVGRNAGNHLVAENISCRRGKLLFTVAGVPFSVRLFGRRYLLPALTAIAAGQHFGRAISEMADALADIRPPALQCEVSPGSYCTVISDCLRESPAAVEQSLELLREYPATRRIVVCGNIPAGAAASLVTRCGADQLIACGQGASETIAAACEAGMPQYVTHLCHDAQDALETLLNGIQPGDAILVRGPAALGFHQLAESLKNYAAQQSKETAIPMAAPE